MNEKIHLKGLNGLRAIAAISVVVFHINHSMTQYGLENLPSLDLAGYGVTMFFAISGFLITYLLLKERSKTGISVKKFYVRRILRIWPLYFLFLALSLLTAWYYNISSNAGSLPFYIFLAANIPFILDTALPFLGHYWSLGVEEQFYLFWPWLVKRSSRLFRGVLLFTLFWFGLRLAARLIEIRTGQGLFYLFVHVTRFDCMAIGALGAILVHENNRRFQTFMMHRLTQIIAWLIVLLILFNQYHLASVVDQEIVAMVTVVLIVNLAFNPASLIHLNALPFESFGRISYGIYVIHQLVIFYFARFINQFSIAPEVKYPLIYFSVIALTLAGAYLSYNYFERPFLKFKERFAIIKTQN